MFPLLLALLAGCDETTSTTLSICEVDLTVAAPAAAAPGDAVVVTARPLTEIWDTALYVGGVRADLTDVSRLDCDDCDTCRDDNGCSACSDCDACDADCDAQCVETATFTAPDLPAGATTIQLFNSHGGSNLLDFEISGAGDTGSGDSGGADSGGADSGG